MSDGRLRGSLANERPSAITEPHAANASGVCRVAIGKMRRENMDENLEELAQDLAKAERKGDVAFLDHTLADDFIGIGPRGFMLTKDEWLARHKSGDLRYESFGLDEVRIRVYGDAAVLTGREKVKLKYRGEDQQAELRTTEVFVKQAGQWQLAGLQLSPIAPPPGAKNR